jgi:hypothetical protein
MAAATKFENVWILADSNTLAGPAIFNLALTAGSDTATLTVTIGSSAIVLKAPANTTVEMHSPLKLGANATASIALTGTSPTAYAIDKVR